MIIFLLFSLVLAEKKICICNFECSPLCPPEKFVTSSSNLQLKDYILSQLPKNKEIALDFYSQRDGFEIDIDTTYLQYQKITLKVITDSKSVTVKFQKGDSSTNKIIELKPDYQIELPELIPFKTTNYPKKNILDDVDSASIPISVGLYQVSKTGSFSCEPNVELSPDKVIDLNCKTTNLDSQSAYQCGFRCWTSGETSLEYSFKGVKFAIFGTYAVEHGTFNLIIDDGNPIEIDEYRENREFYAQIYTSDILDYGDHTIKIQSQNVYELYKIVYWPSLKARRLNSTELTKSSNSDWTLESDGIGGTREYTSTNGATATSSIECSKIWVYGTKASNHDQFNIQFEDDNKDISEYSENRIDGILLYESPDLDFGTHTLKITNLEGVSLIYCVYYLFNPPPQTAAPFPSETQEPTPTPTPIPISVGLTQMTITGEIGCEPSNFGTGNIGSLGCSIEDLETEAAYQCGFRCWTRSANFEYKFKGVQFGIYGTLDPVHGTFDVVIDDNSPIEVDEYKETRQAYVEVYLSDELEYGEHDIKINGKGFAYELYKIVYWPSKRAIRVNSTSLVKAGSWTPETDGIGGVREYSDDPSASVSLTVSCSKVWVYGSTMNWGSENEVHFANEHKTISLITDDRIDASLLYESEYVALDEYTLSITKTGGRTFTVYCIYYDPNIPMASQTISASKTPDPTPLATETPLPTSTPQPTPILTPIPISVGLTQMTITGSFDCEPSNFNIENLNGIGCDIENLETEAAYQCGFRCWTRSANFEYKFKGVQFGIYGTLDPVHGTFDVVIDDNSPIEVDEYKETRQEYVEVYLSDELEYGEHDIKINGKGFAYELYKIVYWPSLRASRINSTSFTTKGEWKSETDGIGGVRTYLDYGLGTATCSFPFSKIWIYGSTTSWSANMIISFAGQLKTVSQLSETRKDQILIYESDDLPYDTYTLSLSSSGGTIIFYCVYYIDEPASPTLSPTLSDTPTISSTPDPTLTATQSPEPSMTPEPTNTPHPTLTVSQSPEPTFTPAPTLTPTPTPVPISVGLTQMKLDGNIYCNIANFDIENLQNLGCNINDLEAESAYKCGYKCWSYGNANLSYTFKGVKFEIYGTFDPFHQKFDLVIDDKPPIVIDEHNQNRHEYVLIYSSEELDYREHTVRIIGRDEIYEIYKLVYWPRLDAFRINSTQFEKTGNWVPESDGVGGVREYTNSGGSTAKTTFYGTKFWLYSSTCTWHDQMILTFDSTAQLINLNSDERVDSALVYESDELPVGDYTIDISSVGTSMLYCLYYLNDPPPPTRTPYPSRTFYPENSETYINKTFINYILTDQIEVTQASPINQISGCKFIDMLEDIDYLIRFEKEIPFFDNTFEYKETFQGQTAPIMVKYNGQLTISNCTFINCISRINEGNVLACFVDNEIDLYLDRCKFVNCGNLTNETIIKISNKDSTISITDCIFSFNNATTACLVLDSNGSYVLFDNCEFDKCGPIKMNPQNEMKNSSFVFTNNVVTSICQEFINLCGLSSRPLIKGNVFQDIQITSGSFINITHSEDEIEFINNTFENMKTIGKETYNGGIGLSIKNELYNMMTLIFDQCKFINNENNQTESSSLNFYGGGAFQCGFLFSFSNISLQFHNCEFKENKCINGKGGALAINIFDDVIISNCTFEDNEADQEGGAIYILGRIQSNDEQSFDQLEINQISIINCNFVGNEANEGSSIYLIEENVNFVNFEVNSCTFLDNSCIDNENCLISSSSKNVQFINSTINYSNKMNQCKSLFLNYTESMSLIESSFINCQSIGDTVFQLQGIQDNSTLNISNTTFIDCISLKYSLTISKGTSLLSNCSFIFSDNRNSCSGLEINSPTSLEIENCEFHRNNNKVFNGGSLFIHNEENKELEKLSINGILFNNCIGSSFRTLSINHYQLKEDLIILNKVVIHNISTGGSIYGLNIDKDVLFNFLDFQNNQFSNEYGGGYGSYLIPPQNIIFNHCNYKGNYCSDNGGAFGGVIYNIDTLLVLKSIQFNHCQFTLNSALGNGGALFIDMASDESPIELNNCTFEVNKASGDCGAIFIDSKNDVVIDSCNFVNNSAFKSLSPSYDPTDSLYIHGNGNVLINQTNFIKGSFVNEQANHQFSHINTLQNEKKDFNVSINYCMFSIINPNMNQLFAQEIKNVGCFYISYSSFTHFITNTNINKDLLLLFESENSIDFRLLGNDDYNHLFTVLNAPVYVIQCCFDNDEYIIKANIDKREKKLTENQVIDSRNNTLNGECYYPVIIEEMIEEIRGNENSPFDPITSQSPKNKKDDKKKKIIIIASAVAAVLLIIIVSALILISVHKKKKNIIDDDDDVNNDNNKKNLNKIEFDSDQIIEMAQETNDSLYSRYDKTFTYSPSYLNTNENSFSNRGKETHSRSSASTSSDFEEAQWATDLV